MNHRNKRTLNKEKCPSIRFNGPFKLIPFPQLFVADYLNYMNECFNLLEESDKNSFIQFITKQSVASLCKKRKHSVDRRRRKNFFFPLFCAANYLTQIIGYGRDYQHKEGVIGKLLSQSNIALFCFTRVFDGNFLRSCWYLRLCSLTCRQAEALRLRLKFLLQLRDFLSVLW